MIETKRTLLRRPPTLSGNFHSLHRVRADGCGLGCRAENASWRSYFPPVKPRLHVCPPTTLDSRRRWSSQLLLRCSQLLGSQTSTRRRDEHLARGGGCVAGCRDVRTIAGNSRRNRPRDACFSDERDSFSLIFFGPC